MWDSGSESGPRAPAGYITLLLSPDVRFNKCSSQSIDMFYLLTYLLPVSASPRLVSKRCAAVLLSTLPLSATAAEAVAVAWSAGE